MSPVEEIFNLMTLQNTLGNALTNATSVTATWHELQVQIGEQNHSGVMINVQERSLFVFLAQDEKYLQAKEFSH